MRIVTVTNMSTNAVDKIVYDPATSTMYLNDIVIGEKSGDTAAPRYIGISGDGWYGWYILAYDSFYISYRIRAAIGAIAGALAGFLGSLGPAGVIAAMSAGVLAA